MIKKIYLLLILSCVTIVAKSQIIYAEHFNNLAVISATQSGGQIYAYADVPNTMSVVSTNSLIADTLTGNYPFRATGQKQKGWLTYKPYVLNDTFAVSTSWFAPVANADVWLVTPIIANVTASTVVSWESMAPDAGHLDGYEVYISTSTSTTVSLSDFTKVMSVSAENASWTTRGLAIGSYTATGSVRIAFRNNSSNQFQLWLDDIVVENKVSAVDMAATTYNTYKYSTVNINNTISAAFKNMSFIPVTVFSVQYKVGGVASTIETVNLSTPLYYNESVVVNFPQPYSSGIAKYNDLKIYITAVNSTNDFNHTNDTVFGSLTLANGLATKKVLLEEYTGAWCGWCPDGATKLQSILTNTNVIAVSHHDADSMQNTNSNSLINDYATNFPSASIDQYQFTASSTLAHDRIEWNALVNQRLLKPSPVNLSINFTTSYDSITRQFIATVNADFLAELKGDYRLNLYIKENNVYGPITDSTNNGWNQLSYMQNVPSSPYYGLGTYYDASHYMLHPAEYKHHYVVNEMLDGAYGSVIPATCYTVGGSCSKSYTTTLPMPTTSEFRYNADNIYLVAVVSEYNADTKKREIINAFESKLTSKAEVLVGLKEFKNKVQNVVLYPNPATDAFTIYVVNNNSKMTVDITDILGNTIYTGISYSDHLVINTSHLSAGNYFVTVKTTTNSLTKKLILTH